MTAEEIRKIIIGAVAKNGGHLASSLGAVEIAKALSEVFDPYVDRIIWDVGHQAYAWKILTDRAEKFDTIRSLGGVSPFSNPLESKADAAIAGHAGVALSIAEGYAAARDLKGTKEHVVAVIGDSSIVNGTSFEALNFCDSEKRKVILVLNDNEMSISKPTGAISKFLGRLITGVKYNRIKTAAENAGHKLKLTFLRDIYHRWESRVKSLFLGSSFFERFGLRYIGPVDGHDLEALKEAFTVAKEDKRSVLVHVVTKKGYGYKPAEMNPTKWHGVGAFDPEQKAVKGAKTEDWSAAFGEILSEEARQDKRIVALTAAMKDGTGLVDFAKEFPERFFDVGIAEGHMVAFAAGLAQGGLKPVVAIYSTFLQRAVDQVMHDLAIARVPVVIAVDRAGVVGNDGKTHQGLYDIAMLKCLPNVKIVQPKDKEDLRALIKEALRYEGPTVIRYPRGKVPLETIEVHEDENAKLQIWATGDQIPKANEIAASIKAGVVFARTIKPFDAERLAAQRKAGKTIVSIENGSIIGGFGELIGADKRFGWPDEYIPHGSQAELEIKYSFSAKQITEELKNG